MTCTFLHVFCVLRAYVLSDVCVRVFGTTGGVMPRVRPDVMPGVRPDVMPGVRPDVISLARKSHFLRPAKVAQAHP